MVKKADAIRLCEEHGIVFMDEDGFEISDPNLISDDEVRNALANMREI